MHKFNLCLIALFLFLSIATALPYEDFSIIDPTGLTNYSIYFNETVYFTDFNVTDEGRIQIYGIITNQSNTFIGYNINSTPSIIEFYGLTSALIFNNSNDVLGSTNIADNTGNVNVTIPVNGWIKILDNYKIVEGETRPDDPITITKSNDNQVTVDSSLNQAINTTVIITPKSTWGSSCENINQLTYNTVTYYGDNARSVCKLLTSVGFNFQLDNFPLNNNIGFTSGTTNMQTTILHIVVGLLSLLVLMIAIAGVFIYIKNNWENLSIYSVMTLGITILVCVILLKVLIDYIFANS